MNLVFLSWWKSLGIEKLEFPDFCVVLCHHAAIIQQLLNSQCTPAGATAVSSPSTWHCTHVSIPPHTETERERDRESQRPAGKRAVWETHYWLYSQPWSWEETTKQNICTAYLIVRKTLRLMPGRQGMNHQDQIFCNPKEKYQRDTIMYFSLLHIFHFSLQGQNRCWMWKYDKKQTGKIMN